MPPRAIETRYKGYRFRSRLEARWAVFFDALQLNWEYEPEGFELGDGRRYLPDFRLNMPGGQTVYVEIKPPTAMTDNQRDKIKLFAKALFDAADEAALIVLRGDPVAADAFMFGVFGGQQKVGPLTADNYVHVWGHLSGMRPEVVKSAAFDSRSARFEHGENGVRRG